MRIRPLLCFLELQSRPSDVHPIDAIPHALHLNTIIISNPTILLYQILIPNTEISVRFTSVWDKNRMCCFFRVTVNNCIAFPIFVQIAGIFFIYRVTLTKHARNYFFPLIINNHIFKLLKLLILRSVRNKLLFFF